MSNCATFLEFVKKINKEGEKRLKLNRVNLCRKRACPNCQWRRSLAWYARFYNAIPSLEEFFPGHRWILGTFTIQNCDVKELKNYIKHLNESFRKLTRRESIPIVGYIRALETTKSKVGEAHPHIHAMFLVDESYFKSDYMHQSEWAQAWKECLGVDYTPIVDIRVVKDKKLKGTKEFNIDSKFGKDSLMGGALEVFKYTFKPMEMINDPDFFFELIEQMHGVRTITMSRNLSQFIKDTEPETEDELVHIEGNNDDEEATEETYVFTWRGDGTPKYILDLRFSKINPKEVFDTC